MTLIDANLVKPKCVACHDVHRQCTETIGDVVLMNANHDIHWQDTGAICDPIDQCTLYQAKMLERAKAMEHAANLRPCVATD